MTCFLHHSIDHDEKNYFKIKKNSKRTESFFIFVLNPEKFITYSFWYNKEWVIVSEIAREKEFSLL
jgi:hypothetical protein